MRVLGKIFVDTFRANTGVILITLLSIISVMGSMLWAVDMILNNLLNPMMKAYQFKDYVTAANMLHQLNSFLLGYGTGIDDLPEFQPLQLDIRDRMNPNLYYKNYYETYSKDILKCMGMYVKDVLDKVKLQNQFAMAGMV